MILSSVILGGKEQKVEKAAQWFAVEAPIQKVLIGMPTMKSASDPHSSVGAGTTMFNYSTKASHKSILLKIPLFRRG